MNTIEVRVTLFNREVVTQTFSAEFTPFLRGIILRGLEDKYGHDSEEGSVYSVVVDGVCVREVGSYPTP